MSELREYVRVIRGMLRGETVAVAVEVEGKLRRIALTQADEMHRAWRAAGRDPSRYYTSCLMILEAAVDR